MSITKLLRQLRSRWWLILLLTVFGLGIAIANAAEANRGLRSQFEARAVITFVTDDAERDRGALVEQLADAQETAREVNADLLAEGATVTANEPAAELVFTARADSEGSAKERAATMRSSYLAAVEQEAGVDIEARRQDIIREAERIVAQLNELAPPEEILPEETPLDPAQQAELDALNSEVAALSQQRTQLAVDLVLAEGGNDRVGTPEEIQSEIDLITTRLEDLYAEIAVITEETGATSDRTTEVPRDVAAPRDETGLPDVDDPEEVEEAWLTAALKARYDELENEFEGLYVTGRAEDVIEDLAPVVVTDLTPEPVSVGRAGALGLGVAIIIGVGLILAESRLRGRVWVATDLPTRFFGELPASAHISRGPLRRRVLTAKRRHAGVQELRNLIVGMLDRSPEPPIVGFSGVDLDHVEVAELASLMARSLAAADRSVLFLDLDFTKDPESHATGPSVADLVKSAREDPEAGAADMKRSLTDLRETKPNLRALPTGTLNDEPVAAVLTSAFRTLMAAARSSSDIVLVVMPQIDHPLSKALSQRVDHVIAVCAVGWSRGARMRRFESVTVPGSAELVGAVLVTGYRPHTEPKLRVRRRRLLSVRRSSSFSHLASSPRGPADAPDSDEV